MTTSEQQISFREPIREYEHTKINGHTIILEMQLKQGEPELARKATKRLADNIDRVFELLPAHARPLLEKTPVFLMYGTKATNGGKNSGCEYFQRNAPNHHLHLDKTWGSSIVVYSADNYVWLSDLWALKVVIHEMAHAYHLKQWPEKHPYILATWQHAVAAGHFYNVTDREGQRVEKAYALANQMEYFAELSCMYFAECNYYPFNREQLKEYDPDGYWLIRKMWND